MDDAEFQRGDVDITYLDRAASRLLSAESRSDLTRPLAVVAALLAEQRRAATPLPEQPTARPPERASAWLLAARREALGGGG